MRFLVTTLAEYQTLFWRDVGLRLRRQGHDVGLVSFDDRSTELLTEAGLTVFSATGAGVAADEASAATLFEEFGVTNPNYWFGHERFAFDERNSERLRRKLVVALTVASDACRKFSRGGPFVMVQELGGFLSVVGSYFAARRNGVEHLFLEPSFFRGRLFFLHNSFQALRVADNHVGEIPQEVREYLAKTAATGAIVIPLKDRHHYTTAWRKILEPHNTRRLLEKLVDKHLRGKRQEFGYIGQQVKTHLRMLINSSRLRRHYTSIEDCGRFVYFPLHVLGDVALTLRAPHLLDQLALIDYLCRSVPTTHRVAVKEHPAMVGAISIRRMRDLLRRYDNLVLLPPTTNNYKVFERASVVVSINSKSGAEAALVGKPVIVLGDAFYADSSLVTRVDRLEDVPDAIARLVREPRRADRQAIEGFFAAVWARSLPGELYVPSEANVQQFSDSIIRAAQTKDPLC